jgi:hypothetical protein
MMQSNDVIKGISYIYFRFPVPENLVFHLRTVAGVGAFVADNWVGPAINRNDLVAYLLLHDVGNIAKMDFTNTSLMTPHDVGKIEHWKTAQAKVHAKYGKDDHQVTLGMIRDLDLPPRVLALLEHDDWRKLDVIAAGNDWEQKIGKYADYRTGPFGVITLQERIADLEKRYAGKLAPEDQENLKKFNIALHNIEAQITKNLRIPVQDITDEAVAKYRLSFV